MGHLSAKDPYRRLRERLDEMPVGAPGRGTIFEILKILLTSEEADLAARMPLRPTPLDRIARSLETPAESLRPRLEALAGRGILLDLPVGERTLYSLNPVIVGIFEFSMMRVREDIDQPRLAGLLRRYLVEEPDFAAALKPGPTSLFRTLVHEEALPEGHAEILGWERATEVVTGSRSWSVGLCHCRHVAHHAGRDCQKFPLETCLTLGSGARYLARNGIARPIEREEALELIGRSREAGLVHIADNVKRNVTFICNCCGCCCEVLEGFRRFRLFAPLASRFVARPSETACTGCKKCQRACPVGAVTILEQPHKVQGRTFKRLARVDPAICLGCGLCALACKFDSMTMIEHERRWITPENAFSRVLRMAIEQGKLHNLLADSVGGMTGQALGTFLGALLNLPPARLLLAQESLKSRFVDFLIARSGAARIRL